MTEAEVELSGMFGDGNFILVCKALLSALQSKGLWSDDEEGGVGCHNWCPTKDLFHKQVRKDLCLKLWTAACSQGAFQKASPDLKL